ncbi:MAG: hypothetical protein P8P49_09845 [Opitutales bacterium]|nr:hypothetical protein [Opitutales bacterium]
MRLLLVVSLFFVGWAQSETLPSITKFPDLPTNYSLRDWKKTARDYDSLAFDQNRSGQFLPLIWMDEEKKVNPSNGFALPTYVGDSRQNPETGLHEAITGIASVLNGTLLGIEKSSFVPLLSSHFHRKNGIGLYLNQVGTRGDSFWYDLLPSLLFSHLYHHYPQTSVLAEQFHSTISKWEQIALQLGNEFDHTGYDFYTKQPVNRGWSEADVVAGLACLQYIGWKKTGKKSYLEMSKKCLTWMDRRKINPYYECLAPFGAYASALHNAERNSTHRTAKFIEWVLAGDNPRKWGAMFESWNGVPVHGLIGSVYPNYEYAFAMNTFQAVGIMAPIARYEDKFARDLAKWILNVASNSRYFYPDAWSREQQTSYEWAQKHDPNFCIPYEGIRKQGTIRNYPEVDKIKLGSLKLGESTNPDKDMFLTANHEGEVHYEGEINLPTGMVHSLIAVIRHRRIENEIQVFIQGNPTNQINYLAQKSDHQKLSIKGKGLIEVVVRAKGLQPSEVIQVQDLVVETRLPNPPHVGGDATIHGWSETDLGLYGGSNIGYLAALIEPTNIEGILAIDPVATDMINPDAFPTRLFYNPFPKAKTIHWNFGKQSVRVYDALANKTILRSVHGSQSFKIPGKQAVMLVSTPSGKPLEMIKGKLVCDRIVVDFQL